MEPTRSLADAVCRARRVRRSAADGDVGQHGCACQPRGGRGKRGEQNQAIGRSRGGRTTKIHALADGCGRLYALLLSPGHSHDIRSARALLSSVAAPALLIADKAYDADNLREDLAAQGIQVVIPPRQHRTNPPPFDPILYRQRNLIERAFCRLKDWRAIATRYDKTARNFLAGVCLAVAVGQWLH